MIIIPIGLQCFSANFLKKINKRHKSYPFDWMFATPKFTYIMLALLLNKKVEIDGKPIESNSINDLVRNHFFDCKDRAITYNMNDYYTCWYGSALYNKRYNVIFPHDSYNEETISKYIRRFEYLKKVILESTEELCFIYASQAGEECKFTINYKDPIEDAYGYFSKIYTLIRSYRENYKMIIFDAIQTDNEENLDKNITLYKIYKYDKNKLYIFSHFAMLDQMEKHVNADKCFDDSSDPTQSIINNKKSKSLSNRSSCQIQ
jgi:hypothetical protein